VVGEKKNTATVEEIGGYGDLRPQGVQGRIRWTRQRNKRVVDKSGDQNLKGVRLLLTSGSQRA